MKSLLSFGSTRSSFLRPKRPLRTTTTTTTTTSDLCRSFSVLLFYSSTCHRVSPTCAFQVPAFLLPKVTTPHKLLSPTFVIRQTKSTLHPPQGCGSSRLFAGTNTFAAAPSATSTARNRFPLSTSMIDLSGLSDSLVEKIVEDLDLLQQPRQRVQPLVSEKVDSDEVVNGTGDIDTQQQQQQQKHDIVSRDLRSLVASFMASHEEAEASVSRLILKHLGISSSIFRPPSRPSITGKIEGRKSIITTTTATTDSREITQLQKPQNCSSNNNSNNFKIMDHDDDHFIVPNQSPVDWLSQSSWEAMRPQERAEFMENALYGFSPNKAETDRYYPTSFRQAVSFGRGGVHRVVLGHGQRRVLVIVGIHGNEFCGVEAVKLLLQQHALFLKESSDNDDNSNNTNGNDDRTKKGGEAIVTAHDLVCPSNWNTPLETLFDKLTMEFIVGNPHALECNQRFLKKNLNRLLDIHLLLDDETAQIEGYEVELQRARILAESIRHSDFVLDLHSVSSDSPSFAMPSSMEISEDFAARLPVSYVVESIFNVFTGGGTTMHASMLYGIPGVCVECGQHNHPDVVARATAVLSSCLWSQYQDEAGLEWTIQDAIPSTLNIIVADKRNIACDEEKVSAKASTLDVKSSSLGIDQAKVKGPIVMRCETIEQVQDGFEFNNADLNEFDFVPFGTPVFRDNVRGQVSCPIEPGAYLVMPTKMPVVGEEALVWAVDNSYQ